MPREADVTMGRYLQYLAKVRLRGGMQVNELALAVGVSPPQILALRDNARGAGPKTQAGFARLEKCDPPELMRRGYQWAKDNPLTEEELKRERFRAILEEAAADRRGRFTAADVAKAVDQAIESKLEELPRLLADQLLESVAGPRELLSAQGRVAPLEPRMLAAAEGVDAVSPSGVKRDERSLGPRGVEHREKSETKLKTSRPRAKRSGST